MNEEGEKEEKEEKVKPKREIGEAKKKKKKKYQPSPLFVYTIRRIIIHILKAIDQGDSKMTPEEDLSSPLNNSDIK
jgi:cytoskeletal protein RodZ